MAAKTAIVAGEGILPVEIAKRLFETGVLPVVLALRSDIDAFGGISESVTRIRCPGVGRIIKEMKRASVQNVILAGRVSKRIIYTMAIIPALFDSVTLKTLAKSARDDHSLLASVVEAIEEAGIKVIPYYQILPELLASEGRISERAPNAEETRDIECGEAVLRVTLPMSFGQAVIVAGGAVVALEALEGTDAMIERSSALVKNGVLVKMMRIDQDTRYDMPTVGPATIAHMARAGLTCLAVESRRTLIMEPQETFSLAERHNIAIWGLPCQIRQYS
ncbi:phosphatidate cytidylyltransferase [Synergistales bacterium]|nr:phosphatidate cytidylyltransferase [Synergistales bacterium]